MSKHTAMPLKPCPFCGKEDLKIGHSPSGFVSVYCLPCHIAKHTGDEEYAITAWNRRADINQQLVDALQMAKRYIAIKGTGPEMKQVFDALEAAGVRL